MQGAGYERIYDDAERGRRCTPSVTQAGFAYCDRQMGWIGGISYAIERDGPKRPNYLLLALFLRDIEELTLTVRVFPFQPDTMDGGRMELPERPRESSGAWGFDGLGAKQASRGYRRKEMPVASRREWCRDRADILDILPRISIVNSSPGGSVIPAQPKPTKR